MSSFCLPNGSSLLSNCPEGSSVHIGRDFLRRFWISLIPPLLLGTGERAISESHRVEVGRPPCEQGVVAPNPEEPTRGVYMAERVGVIGVTGRMGVLLADLVSSDPQYRPGVHFARSRTPAEGLDAVFGGSDYVVDFSHPALTGDVLQAALRNPKPLVICTTGWSWRLFGEPIERLAGVVSIVIAPNTSVGACLQRHVVSQLANLLDERYDIDIADKHHRNKVDSPSGTAMSLLRDIQRVRGKAYAPHDAKEGPRPQKAIGMVAERSGNLPGEHTVCFTGAEEMISIKHVAFNRCLFARGALNILGWLRRKKPAPGVYGMLDVLGIGEEAYAH